jgi:hypothetical protein
LGVSCSSASWKPLERLRSVEQFQQRTSYLVLGSGIDSGSALHLDRLDLNHVALGPFWRPVDS